MIKKKKKQRLQLNKRLIVLSIIVIIFIICIGYNIISLFINPTDTFMIENGRVASTEETTGYVIREEKIFQGKNYKNGISQIKTEGQRVAKGDPIYRYYTNNEEGLTKKIAELDTQIQDAIEQSNNIYSSDIASIDKQIEEKLRGISGANKTSDIVEYKKDINNSLTKKAKLTGELSPSGSYIKELISKRSEYEQKLNSGSEYIEATISGLVSYKVDGLENILTPENLNEITEEYLSNLKLKTGQVIASNSECAKIVNNYSCYVATITKSEEAKKVAINDTIPLVLSTGNEIDGKVISISEQESGNLLLIFEITEGVEQLISYRKISVEIIWWSASGLRVPNSSIAKRDGKSYIIRKRIGYTDDILVKVLKESDDYSIIENYTSIELKKLGYSTEEINNMKNISLYDEILLNPTR